MTTTERRPALNAGIPESKALFVVCKDEWLRRLLVIIGGPCTDKLFIWWGIFHMLVLEKIHTVSLNANLILLNVRDTGTLLKEWCDNQVFSIKMDLFLLLHSVTDTENEPANSVSLTLRAKGLVEIQIGYPSETTLIVYQYL